MQVESMNSFTLRLTYNCFSGIHGSDCPSSIQHLLGWLNDKLVSSIKSILGTTMILAALALPGSLTAWLAKGHAA
jgi:hypothetical protein